MLLIDVDGASGERRLDTDAKSTFFPRNGSDEKVALQLHDGLHRQRVQQELAQ